MGRPRLDGPLPAGLLPRALEIQRRQAVVEDSLREALCSNGKHRAFADRVNLSSGQRAGLPGVRRPLRLTRPRTAPPPARNSPMKILVADDSRVMRRIIIRTLRQAGFGGHEIIEAANGREAVALVATEPPDLVLSDWHMPVMNGIDALARCGRRGRRCPFGFVTSEGSETVRAAAPPRPARVPDRQAVPGRTSSGRHWRASFQREHERPPPAAGSRCATCSPTSSTGTCSCRPCVPVAPGPAMPASVATSTSTTGAGVGAVISCDLELSARAGAAIGLVPSSGAERAIRSGCHGRRDHENLREVFDVAATYVRPPARSTCGCTALHPAGVDLPHDVAPRALTLGRRADVGLDIAGYGAGRLSVVLV